MMTHYKVLPENTRGRDFAIGDIHGAYDLLERALNQINFDPAVDRLISVGDLIDRGPRSKDCLGFLQQPWFHAIKGNHEDLFLQTCDENGVLDQSMAQFNIRNGMGWIFDETPGTLKSIRESFLSLPVAMETKTARGSVAFVHADIPDDMEWLEFIDAIEAHDEHVIETALWGRTRVQYDIDSGIRGIDRIFFGHTPQTDGAKRLGNCYYIDTGAVFRMLHGSQGRAYHLTCTDVMAATGHFNSKENSLSIVIKERSPQTDAPIQPFGKYAR